MSDTAEKIHQTLRQKFSPTYLEVFDDSAMHAGHAGASEHGGGHFRVVIQAAAFRGLPRLTRHRMVMEALKEGFQHRIHALSLRAEAPEEQR